MNGHLKYTFLFVGFKSHKLWFQKPDIQWDYVKIHQNPAYLIRSTSST